MKIKNRRKEVLIRVLKSHPLFGPYVLSAELVFDDKTKVTEIRTEEGRTQICINPEFWNKAPLEYIVFFIMSDILNILLDHKPGPPLDLISYDLSIYKNLLLVPTKIESKLATYDKFKFPKKLSAKEYKRLLIKDGWQDPSSSQGEHGQYKQNQISTRKSKYGVETTIQNIKTGKQMKFICNPITKTQGFEKQKLIDSIRRAAGRMAGTLPAYLENIIKESDSKLKWNILRTFISNSYKDHRASTWSKRNRRIPEFPGHKILRKSVAAIGFDVSGSITDEEYKKSISETSAILEHAELDIAQFDTEIKRTFHIDDKSKVPNLRRRKGYGGTDFRPWFKWAENLKQKPDFGIIFTDTYGPWPTKKPSFPVIVVIFRSGNKNNVPPFLRVLEFE